MDLFLIESDLESLFKKKLCRLQTLNTGELVMGGKNFMNLIWSSIKWKILEEDLGMFVDVYI